jgi:hypothetical protein
LIHPRGIDVDVEGNVYIVGRKTALFGLKRKTQGDEIPKSVVEIVLICFPSLVI